MPTEEWKTGEHVRRYLGRADEFPHRREGESVLLDHVPRDARRILDLGTGDGRLLALLQVECQEMRGVGLDFSEMMLDAARERFADDQRIELVQHDLAQALPALGHFDAVVSSMAIHHLEHERKRSLYGEVFDLLEPGGVFANFEHVASPTERLHLAFFGAIGEPLEHEDPSDRLVDVESQLAWMRELGFEDVDCYWKWLEMALLIGVKPGAGRRPYAEVLQIRRAQAEDAAGLADQMRVVVDEGRWLATESDRSVEELTERFRSALGNEHILHVLEHDGRIVGAIGIHPTGVSGVHSLMMSILREFRGQGWGRRLIIEALDAAREADVRKVVLEVFPDNGTAISLYASSGFEIEGYKRDHYPRRDGSLRSAILMARFL